MEKWNIAQSTTRKTSAWLAEKIVQVKLVMDDVRGGSFQIFEISEALSLGIEGKKLLWQALSTVAEMSPRLQGPEYPRLIRRAEEQRDRVEAIRRSLACECLKIAS